MTTAHYHRMVYGPGTPVKVTLRGGKMVDGVLLSFYYDHVNWCDLPNRSLFWNPPRIMLKKSRRIVLGLGCWWIPTEEAELIRREAQRRERESG